MEVPQEMVLRYMERRKKDLETCLLCLQDQNFSELEKVGHQLKGNGVTFGYEDLSQLGNELEAAARKKDVKVLEKTLKDFSHWVNEHVN